MLVDAFILAAGFGTRLRPLTLYRPKPLVPVCGVPMLSYAIALCRSHGLRNIIVNSHHLAQQLQSWEGEHDGVMVKIAHETPEILGTGGGLVAVRGQLAEKFAVVNADVLSNVDLSTLMKQLDVGTCAMALRAEEAERYGVVAMDSEDVVVDLVNLAHATPVGEARRDTHFTGVHAMRRSVLDGMQEGFSCVIRTAYASQVPKRSVMGQRHGGLWLDVGDPLAYLQANLAVLGGLPPLPLDPFSRAAWGRCGELETGDSSLVSQVDCTGSVWVGKDVAFGARVRVHQSIVGDGAYIADGATLNECVVWDGMRVPAAQFNRCIFYPGGILSLMAPTA
jgi:mannose-1-phosphate guanylyltransferase